MLIAEMQILYSFGLYLAIGVVVSFIILCLFIPAGLMVFYRPRQPPAKSKIGLTGNKLLYPTIYKKCLSPPMLSIFLCWVFVYWAGRFGKVRMPNMTTQ